MTELEINKAAAKKLGLAYEVTRYGVVTRVSNKEQWREFDPCNNVEQAWEIMLKYNICVTKEGRKYRAIANMKWDGSEVWCSGAKSHQKPLVAAMLCFLEL